MIQNFKLFLAFAMLASFPASYAVKDENEGTPYGVDCSFPIHYEEMRCGDLLGDRQKVYDDYMNGCRKEYGAAPCDDYESGRLEMSLAQPASMVNYTSTGFKHIKAPPQIWELLKNFWEANKEQQKIEYWPRGNVYVNHWESPTYMVNVEDEKLVGGGMTLKNAIWDAAKETIEEWTQMELRSSSMYGIRVYTEGAILSPHADRNPLISSCIINVAQDVDEDWVLEVYDRQGNAVNVTMEPGDMVLYESGTLIHGRPFAMKGRYYANIFIHFEPTGRPLNYEGDDWEDNLDNFLPPYLIPGTPWIDEWSRRNPSGWKRSSPSAARVASSEIHLAAANNDIQRMMKLHEKYGKQILFSKDKNGWQPIHEAARGGHKDAIEYLVTNGADVNALTHTGFGESPLHIAIVSKTIHHPVSKYLEQLGAVDLGATPEEL